MIHFVDINDWTIIFLKSVFLLWWYQVFMVDFGYSETIQTSELRNLKKHLSQSGAFSFLCHLAEVVPAGDQSMWSRTACEFMVEETHNKKLYIKKKVRVGCLL